MSLNIKVLYTLLSLVLFIVLPIIFFSLEPSRTLLKDTISIFTIISFFVLIAQFFLSKINESIKKVFSFAKVVKWHKVIAYTILPILLFHPFLIVLPRFFEVGVNPFESFIKMITTFDNLGVLLGLLAWVSMLILGLTSMFRDKLNMSYKSWKIFHGILSLFFIVIAAWHTIDIGRHMNILMSALIVILVFVSSALIVKSYLFKTKKGVER